MQRTHAYPIVLSLLLAACSGGQTPAPPVSAVPQALGRMAEASLGTPTPASVLATLDEEQTVGSATDPVTGDVNPYGLDIAKVSLGHIDAGDLVVCEFNNKQNVQGTGTSILAIHPAIGSVPRHIAAFSALTGCDALAASPSGAIWNAAFAANDNPIVTAGGALSSALAGGPWNHPFGEAFVPPVNALSLPAFYVSNAGDGSLVRVYVHPGNRYTYAVIARGFPVNGGAPGSILGPSGLTYQPAGDRLYVVDGTDNALYALDNVSKIEANGIAVSGRSFSGKFAADAHVVYMGAPLNGPISSALLPGGSIVLGNTLDPNGQNLMVEISPAGRVLNVKNVDSGPAGAIFGMAATGGSSAAVKLYFNDDNDNTVKVLTQ